MFGFNQLKRGIVVAALFAAGFSNGMQQHALPRSQTLITEVCTSLEDLLKRHGYIERSRKELWDYNVTYNLGDGVFGPADGKRDAIAFRFYKSDIRNSAWFMYPITSLDYTTYHRSTIDDASPLPWFVGIMEDNADPLYRLLQDTFCYRKENV